MINDYNFVTPESEGISSEDILDFIEFFKELRINVHSFLIARNGNIVAEGYYKPFCPETKKRLYSCSKSVVSLAVGKLVGEGLVDLNTPIYKYFEGVTPDPVMAEVTVEDTLMMCVPQAGGIYCKFHTSRDTDYTRNDDWVETYFSSKFVADKPRGRLFAYNSHASSILSELVYRMTGKNFLEYLRPEFDKIGVSRDIECIEMPSGVAWGASGVLATTRDFAKIGELVLNRGMYKGEELISREYMERATTKRTDTVFGEDIKPGSYGYGYHIWVEPYGFGLHGMRGQVVFCFPDKNFMVVINSNEPDFANKYYYVASRLYKKIKDAPLAENPDSYAKLKEVIEGLEIDRSFGEAHSPMEKIVGKRRYQLRENSMNLDSFTLDFDGEEGVLRFVKDGEEKTLAFGYGTYSDTLFPDKNFYGKRVNVRSGREFRTLSTGSWTSPDRLIIMADISDDTPGSLGIVFEFSGDEVAVQLTGKGEGILADYNGMTGGKAVG